MLIVWLQERGAIKENTTKCYYNPLSCKKIANNSYNFGLITNSSAIMVFEQNGLFSLILNKIFPSVKRGSEQPCVPGK